MKLLKSKVIICNEVDLEHELDEFLHGKDITIIKTNQTPTFKNCIVYTILYSLEK